MKRLALAFVLAIIPIAFVIILGGPVWAAYMLGWLTFWLEYYGAKRTQ